MTASNHLPLPGDVCTVRDVPWLEVPMGWSVRSDGVFWYFVQGARLRAFVRADAPTEMVCARLRETVAGPDPSEVPSPEDVAEAEQGFRLFAALQRVLHGQPMARVMPALEAIAADAFSEFPDRLARATAIANFMQGIAVRSGLSSPQLFIASHPAPQPPDPKGTH